MTSLKGQWVVRVRQEKEKDSPEAPRGPGSSVACLGADRTPGFLVGVLRRPGPGTCLRILIPINLEAFAP